MTADQQIVEQHVDDRRRDVGGHRDFGVAGTALGGVDDQRHDIEEHASLNDIEVCDSRGMGIRIGTAYGNDLVGEGDRQYRQHQAGDDGKHDCCHQDFVGVFPVILTASSGNQRRYGNVAGEEYRQGNEFRLGCQADSRNSIGSQRRYHHGIDHSGQ